MTDKNGIKIEIDGEHKKAKIVMPKKIFIMTAIVAALSSIVIFCVKLSCNLHGVQCQTSPKYGIEK